MCFYYDRCPVKPISLERATWDLQQRSHPLTTLREASTSEHYSPVDFCFTTVKGYIQIHVFIEVEVLRVDILYSALLNNDHLLLLQSDEFSISLENGAVVMNCRGTKVKSHKKQYNDGRTHFLVASVNNQK